MSLTVGSHPTLRPPGIPRKACELESLPFPHGGTAALEGSGGHHDRPLDPIARRARVILARIPRLGLGGHPNGAPLAAQPSVQRRCAPLCSRGAEHTLRSPPQARGSAAAPQGLAQRRLPSQDSDLRSNRRATRGLRHRRARPDRRLKPAAKATSTSPPSRAGGRRSAAGACVRLPGPGSMHRTPRRREIGNVADTLKAELPALRLLKAIGIGKACPRRRASRFGRRFQPADGERTRPSHACNQPFG